jgi:hypothetical protein
MNKIVAKSKTLINSYHANKAQELIDNNPKLQEFILENYDSVLECYTYKNNQILE